MIVVRPVIPDDAPAWLRMRQALWPEEAPQPKIVRATRDRKASITDGPFAETKEAYAIAARASAAPGQGGQPLNMPIEVRQVMDGPPPID